MCCTFVKWITVVITVKIQINRDQIHSSQLFTVAETLTRDNIETFWVVHVTNKTSSNSDDWIYLHLVTHSLFIAFSIIKYYT
jgi:hypothetical protein